MKLTFVILSSLTCTTGGVRNPGDFRLKTPLASSLVLIITVASAGSVMMVSPLGFDKIICK